MHQALDLRTQALDVTAKHMIDECLELHGPARLCRERGKHLQHRSILLGWSAPDDMSARRRTSRMAETNVGAVLDAQELAAVDEDADVVEDNGVRQAGVYLDLFRGRKTTQGLAQAINSPEDLVLPGMSGTRAGRAQSTVTAFQNGSGRICNAAAPQQS